VLPAHVWLPMARSCDWHLSESAASQAALVLEHAAGPSSASGRSLSPAPLRLD
jgi:hypothetical protein